VRSVATTRLELLANREAQELRLPQRGCELVALERALQIFQRAGRLRDRDAGSSRRVAG